MDDGKGYARGNHQTGASQQELTMIMSDAKEPDTYCQQRGAKERRRGDDTDLQGSESEGEQVDGQQHGHEAVSEIPQSAGGKEKSRRMYPLHRSGLSTVLLPASASRHSQPGT